MSTFHNIPKIQTNNFTFFIYLIKGLTAIFIGDSKTSGGAKITLWGEFYGLDKI